MYKRKDSLDKHRAKGNCQRSFREVEWQCDICPKAHSHKSSLDRHLKTHLTSQVKRDEVKAFSEGNIPNVDEDDVEEVYNPVLLKKITVCEFGPTFSDYEELIFESPSKNEYVHVYLLPEEDIS